MRIVVAVEGKRLNRNDGRVLAPGALYVEDEKIPVVWLSAWDTPIGFASDFERNSDTGEASFEISLDEFQEFGPEYFDGGFEAQPYVAEEKDNVVLYTKARVRTVTLSLSASHQRVQSINGVEL